jgi:hypothetical protein
MTIKMIVDECDKYELPDITDTFSFSLSPWPTCSMWNHCDFFKIIVVFYDPLQFYYTESQSTTSTFRSGI